MRRSQITYIKQKLMRLSKEDLTEFAKFTNTWIRPYWPKSEIAEAIISGEKENVVLKLKAWAKRVGKEQLILGSEPDPFWEQKPRGKPVPEDDSKT